MCDSLATSPALRTATTEGITTCLNAWDVGPPCPISGHIPMPHPQQGNSLAAAAAMKHRQLKQQKQHLLASSCAMTGAPIQAVPVSQAQPLAIFTASLSGSALLAADCSSSNGSGSSVSSLYGRLRSGSKVPQTCMSGAAAAGTLRDVYYNPQLLNKAVTSAVATSSISSARCGPTSVDQAANADMLSLLLAATHMSPLDAVDPTHSTNTASYMTTVADCIIPADAAAVSITSSSIAATPPGLPSMVTPAMWPNKSNTYTSNIYESSGADVLQAHLMQHSHMPLLWQLQGNQAMASTATAAADQCVQVVQAPTVMHAAAAAPATAPAGMQLGGYGSGLTAQSQLAYLQQQQQMQAMSLMDLNAAANSNICNDSGMPAAMSYCNPATAVQAATAQTYQMPSATNTMLGMQDAGFILQPLQQQQQQLLQVTHGQLSALTHVNTASASGPPSVGPMGTPGGQMVGPQTLQGLDAAMPGSSSSSNFVGDSSWEAKADRYMPATAPHNPLYKTELCRTWVDAGSCRYGARCQFAHGQVELRPVLRPPKYKTQPCRTFSLTGQCPYGARCNFIHDEALVLSSSVLGGLANSSSGPHTDNNATDRDADEAATGVYSMLNMVQNNLIKSGIFGGLGRSAAGGGTTCSPGTSVPGQGKASVNGTVEDQLQAMVMQRPK